MAEAVSHFAVVVDTRYGLVHAAGPVLSAAQGRDSSPMVCSTVPGARFLPRLGFRSALVRFSPASLPLICPFSRLVTGPQGSRKTRPCAWPPSARACGSSRCRCRRSCCPPCPECYPQRRTGRPSPGRCSRAAGRPQPVRTAATTANQRCGKIPCHLQATISRTLTDSWDHPLFHSIGGEKRFAAPIWSQADDESGAKEKGADAGVRRVDPSKLWDEKAMQAQESAEVAAATAAMRRLRSRGAGESSSAPAAAGGAGAPDEALRRCVQAGAWGELETLFDQGRITSSAACPDLVQALIAAGCGATPVAIRLPHAPPSGVSHTPPH